MINSIYKGDNIEFECNADLVITGFKIKCIIWSANRQILKATANAGGSDSEILITDGANGIFSIFIDKGETSDFAKFVDIEIQVETPAPLSKVYTGYRGSFQLKERKII